MPPGTYRTGAHTTQVVFADDPKVDLNNPETHRRYFELLYPIENLDEHGIDALRERLAFAQVARKYRLIPDDTIPVAIPWRESEELLGQIEAAGTITRDDLRRLQPFIVGMRPWEHQQAVDQRLCRTIIEGVGLWRWEGGYDRDLGITIEPADSRTVI
jgi:CRISPR-associated endonuclease/helicase Cas3